MLRGSIIALALALSGCATFPDLDSTIDEAARNAPFPTLINIDQLRGTVPSSQPEPLSLDARLANLEARADRLRGPVVDAQTQARMEDGVR